MPLERDYQRYLIRLLQDLLPHAIILKNDPSYIQGFPDLLILNGNKWAALEVKGSMNAAMQMNQAYWVERLDEMSFSAFIYPENEEEVLDALQRALKPRRAARVSKR